MGLIYTEKNQSSTYRDTVIVKQTQNMTRLVLRCITIDNNSWIHPTISIEAVLMQNPSPSSSPTLSFIIVNLISC